MCIFSPNRERVTRQSPLYRLSSARGFPTSNARTEVHLTPWKTHPTSSVRAGPAPVPLPQPSLERCHSSPSVSSAQAGVELCEVRSIATFSSWPPPVRPSSRIPSLSPKHRRAEGRRGSPEQAALPLSQLVGHSTSTAECWWTLLFPRITQESPTLMSASITEAFVNY